MAKWITVKIKLRNKKEIERLKTHPRETIDDVLEKLILISKQGREEQR